MRMPFSDPDLLLAMGCSVCLSWVYVFCSWFVYVFLLVRWGCIPVLVFSVWEAGGPVRFRMVGTSLFGSDLSPSFSYHGAVFFGVRLYSSIFFGVSPQLVWCHRVFGAGNPAAFASDFL